MLFLTKLKSAIRAMALQSKRGRFVSLDKLAQRKGNAGRRILLKLLPLLEREVSQQPSHRAV